MLLSSIDLSWARMPLIPDSRNSEKQFSKSVLAALPWEHCRSREALFHTIGSSNVRSKYPFVIQNF